jgi:hypothetical protein
MLSTCTDPKDVETSTAHQTAIYTSIPRTGDHLWEQLEHGLALRVKHGYRQPAGAAVYQWAPKGKSPATSMGPTGANYQKLAPLLPDGDNVIIFLEASFLGADPAAVLLQLEALRVCSNPIDTTVYGTLALWVFQRNVKGRDEVSPRGGRCCACMQVCVRC